VLKAWNERDDGDYLELISTLINFISSWILSSFIIFYI